MSPINSVRASLIAALAASTQTYASEATSPSTELDVLQVTAQPLPEKELTASELEQNIRSVHRIDLEDIDQPASRIEDLSYLIPGVQEGVDDGGLSTSLFMRGFKPIARDPINGFRGIRPNFNGLPDIQRLFVRDLITVDSVEVLSGPDAIMQGLTSPGGTLRYIGKQPKFEHQSTIGFQASSISPFYEHNGSRLTLDTTGPINDQLAYRFIAASQDQDVSPNNMPAQRGHILGAFSWHYAENGHLRLESEYQENRQPYLFGSVIREGQPIYDHYFASPDQESVRRYRRHAGYWSHDWMINANNEFNFSASYARAYVDRKEELLGFWAQLPNDDEYIEGYYSLLEDDYQQDSWRFQADWLFTPTSDTQHQFTILTDRHQEAFDFNRAKATRDFKLDINARTFQPLTKDTGEPIDVDDIAAFSWFDQNTNRSLGVAGAYQLQTRLLDRDFYWSTGARYNEYDNQMQRWGAELINQDDLTTTIDANSLTWQVGFQANIYGPLYFHASHSLAAFPPISDRRDREGDLLDNEEILMTETGVHFLQSAKHHASVTTYFLERKNMAEVDADYEGAETVFKRSGSQESAGIEANYRLSRDNWNLRLNTSYLFHMDDSRPTHKDQDFPGVARLTAGGRLGYNFSTANSFKWHPWFSGRHMSKRYADTQNDVSVPSWTRWDTGVSLSKENMRLGLSVTNLLDRKYVSYLGSVNDVYQGERRRIWLSMEASF